MSELAVTTGKAKLPDGWAELLERERVAREDHHCAEWDYGQALASIKAELRHGEWYGWCDAAGIAVRTAQRYLRIAADLTRSEAAGLSLNGMERAAAAKKTGKTLSEREPGWHRSGSNDNNAAAVSSSASAGGCVCSVDCGCTACCRCCPSCAADRTP